MFDEIDSVNWLDVHVCNDSCDDGLIDSPSLDSPDSPSLAAHVSDPILELKPLPDSFKYVFSGLNETFTVIITSDLNEDQEDKLLKVLIENKEVIGWTLGGMKGISPQLCNTKFIWRIMLNLIEITKYA